MKRIAMALVTWVGVFSGVLTSFGMDTKADIVITLKEGTVMAFPYCWKKGNLIHFETPGGTHSNP